MTRVLSNGGVAWSALALCIFVGSPSFAVGLPELLVDLVPGPDDSFNISIDGEREMLVLDGVGYFRGDDPLGGRELYRTDGTAAGTFRVKDLWPGVSSGTPLDLVTLNGALFFSATDGLTGRELWTSDGTENGTLNLDLVPGVSGSDPVDLVVAGDLIHFGGRNAAGAIGWWTSDGTLPGTVELKPLPNHFWREGEFAVAGGLVFMVVQSPTEGEELWRSDGTEAGTFVVKDILAGAGGSNPRELTVVDGIVYFRANDGLGEGLWRSDGTEAGTFELVKVLFISQLVEHQGALYFRALESFDVGTELWKSDGTEAGTSMLIDLLPGSGSSNPFGLRSSAGLLYFIALTALGNQVDLYVSDGTAAGTQVVVDLDPNSPTDKSVAVGANLFFADGIDKELWFSDGTAGGTAELGEIRPGGSRADVRFFLDDAGVIGDQLIFIADDGIHGYELWTVELDPPELSLTLTAPACPGPSTMTASGGVSDGFFALFFSESPGTFVVQGATCLGTELNLDQPQMLDVFAWDEFGALSLDIDLPPAACGKSLQVVAAPLFRAAGACPVSNVVVVPSED